MSVRARVLGAALLALAGSSACTKGDAKGAPAQDPKLARQQVDELIAAFQPVPPEATSDLHDAALRKQVLMLERLRTAGEAVGHQALKSFQASAGAPDDLRGALLEVAAFNLAADTAELLARMVVEYDAKLGLGLRNRAVGILARTSPQRGLEVLEPLARDPRRPGTLPPQASIVEGYAVAARAAGVDATPVLADVATNIYQPADARHAAVSLLGQVGGHGAQLALEEVLGEPSSDGYLRRKAAQSLQRILPPEVLCPLLERTVENEVDQGFLLFVRSMMDASCP